MSCFCTVVTSSHLQAAWVLARTLREAGNLEPIQVLVTDVQTTEELPAREGLHYLTLNDLSVPVPPLMRYYFDAFEFVNALKPFMVHHLLQSGAAKVVYLDTDIYVVGSFAPIWTALDEHPVVITPHQLRPPPLTLRHTSEIEIIDQGLYNGGFSAWCSGPACEPVLDWFQSRVAHYGFNDRRGGMFVDQKLMPLLPHYFPSVVQVLDRPTLNIAFWNVHERPVCHQQDRWSLDGQPVVFFHMSGFRERFPDRACSYLPAEANASILVQAPWFRQVMQDYASILTSTSVPPGGAPSAPYPYDSYNGIRLFPEVRRQLHRNGRLSRADPATQRALLLQALKLIKRRILRWLNRTPQ